MSSIDLSQLPSPKLIEELDFESILAEMRARLIFLQPDIEAVLNLESEPINKVLEVCAYREMLLRHRINTAARAVMLAYAEDNDLDHLGALLGVKRLEISPANPEAIPPVDRVMEKDKDYRNRIQLAPEGFSTAGPEGAYIFHALSAGGDVLDASATSPSPGEVVISVLSRAGDGTAMPALLALVDSSVNADDVRPLTDLVTVQSAEIIPFTITAEIHTYPGPSSDVVIAGALEAVEEYVARCHRIGLDISRSGIFAALHREGVSKVELTNPAADISVTDTQATWCSNIELNYGGVWI